MSVAFYFYLVSQPPYKELVVSLALGLEVKFWGHMADVVGGLIQHNGNVLNIVVGRQLLQN